MAIQDSYFHVFKKGVVVSGDMPADVSKQLPPEKHDIIPLSYFLEMTGAEISKIEYLPAEYSKAAHPHSDAYARLALFMSGQKLAEKIYKA